MSSLPPPSLSPDAPPRGRTLWDLCLPENRARFEAFLKGLEDMYVVDEASEARLRRVCAAVDADVSTNGRNLVFYLSKFSRTSREDLTRVLSLGVRPDVPDSTGTLPMEKALSWRKFRRAKFLAMCRPELPRGVLVYSYKVSSEHVLWVRR